MVLFVMFYKVVLTVESVEQIFKYDHSNESYRAVLAGVAVVSVDGSFERNHSSEIYSKDLSSYF